MKKRKSKLPVLLILVFAAVGAWYWLKPAQNANPATSSKDQPVTITVDAATKQNMPVEIDAVGTVTPRQSVGVRSRIDSQITAVKFHDGDMVKAGDVLFTLDNRALEAQLGQTLAALQVDKSQTENLQQQYDRAKKGFEGGFSSEAILDSAKAALDANAATIKADEANVKNIQTQLDYAVIRAPIDGRTGTINITVGNNVKANDTQALVTINQVQPIYVQASIQQDSFEPIRGAMGADPIQVAATRAGAVVAQGTLAYIDNAIDATTGTFVTRASFANEDEHLWPGMLVNLSIKLGEDKDALVILTVAIQHDNSGDFVFLVADGKAHKKNVKVARIQGEQAIIADGLAENDQVAADGIMSLKDGASVTLAGVKKDMQAPDAAKADKQITPP